MTSPLCSLCGHKASSHGSEGCCVVDPYLRGTLEKCPCGVAMKYDYSNTDMLYTDEENDRL